MKNVINFEGVNALIRDYNYGFITKAEVLSRLRQFYTEEALDELFIRGLNILCCEYNDRGAEKS